MRIDDKHDNNDDHDANDTASKESGSSEEQWLKTGLSTTFYPRGR